MGTRALFFRNALIRTFAIVVSLLLVFSTAFKPESAYAGQWQTHSKFTHKGIDVSEWQYDIDWNSVKGAGIEYAIIRCGYSTSHIDSSWLKNVKGAQSAGIPFGVYIYSLAQTPTDARREAEHVLSLLKEAGLTPQQVAFPIYLDYEDSSCSKVSNAQIADIFEIFKSTLNAQGYKKVGVYSGAYWWLSKLNQIEINSVYKWIASYGVSDPFWGDYSKLTAEIWQCSSEGRIVGINGNTVDLNLATDAFMSIAKGSLPSNPGEPKIVKLPVTGGEYAITYNEMYRLYNPYTGEHFYTAQYSERVHLVSVGWHYEGIGWKAPTQITFRKKDTSNQITTLPVAPQLNPVYRLYNPYMGDHHYTLSAVERDNLVKAGWRYEGVGWQSISRDFDAAVPLLREYNPNQRAWNHNFTTSLTEHTRLVKLGWRDEGVAWYGVQ